ncbi:PTS sugar transporter subunit IIA [Enterococcus sp. LJL128]|uniref:PTS sugar transporter subunit IIA n=1 Tax=Enterococcus sp. LJL51 TaxID=3416656 RepID=UPI003CEA0F0D
MYRPLSKNAADARNSFYAVADGTAVKINEVADPVFSQKLLGDGYAVFPENGIIHAPVFGRIISIYKTKHAMNLRMDNDVEILLHMGIDTWELQGFPFDLKVTVGELVTPQMVVAEVNLDELKEFGKETDMIVAITSNDEAKKFVMKKSGKVKVGEKIGEIID